MESNAKKDICCNINNFKLIRQQLVDTVGQIFAYVESRAKSAMYC